MKSRAAVAFGPGQPLEIVEIDVAPPKKGEVLVIIEAMKMEHSISAPYDGKVINVDAIEGQQVNEGFTVAEMEVK